MGRLNIDDLKEGLYVRCIVSSKYVLFRGKISTRIYKLISNLNPLNNKLWRGEEYAKINPTATAPYRFLDISAIDFSEEVNGFERHLYLYKARINEIFKLEISRVISNPLKTLKIKKLIKKRK